MEKNMTASQILDRLTACGIPADKALSEKLLAYHALLMDWNTRMDLTAITDEADMLDRHYADSLMPLALPGLLPASGTAIDVGTGAGLPGLPLALALPAWNFTLLDAQLKRVTFLENVVSQLHLTNVTTVHARAEDAAQQSGLRASFDLAVARAVAPLPVLAEYLLPFVRIGGCALAWKGPSVTGEWKDGEYAAHVLGAHLDPPVPYTLPGRDFHPVLVRMPKCAATPRRYPRKAGKPSREPLCRKSSGPAS